MKDSFTARITRFGLPVLFACFLSLCALHVAGGPPFEKVDFVCESDFRSVVQTNEVLLVAGVDVTTASNGKTYLLALGTAINQARESSDIKMKLDTRKVAEAKARKQAAEFLQTEVHTETRLTEIRNSERVTTNEGLKHQFAKVIKIREEIIVQRSQLTLGGFKTVATWFSDDNTIFKVVVAVEVGRKGKE